MSISRKGFFKLLGLGFIGTALRPQVKAEAVPEPMPAPKPSFDEAEPLWDELAAWRPVQIASVDDTELSLYIRQRLGEMGFTLVDAPVVEIGGTQYAAKTLKMRVATDMGETIPVHYGEAMCHILVAPSESWEAAASGVATQLGEAIIHTNGTSQKLPAKMTHIFQVIVPNDPYYVTGRAIIVRGFRAHA